MSSRSQIGTIALARSIAEYDDRPAVTEEDFAQASELRRYGLGDYYWRSLRCAPAPKKFTKTFAFSAKVLYMYYNRLSQTFA